MQSYSLTFSRDSERRLWLTLAIASSVTVIELFGGISSHSLALLSDSGHVFTDVLTIGVSILTLRLARRPHSSTRTFGYHRAEILSALVNGSTLTFISFLIIYQAYQRLLQPSQVQGSLVVLIALVGLAGNLTIARLFLKSRRNSLNVKGVFLHAIGDILSSSGVVIGGLIVVFTSYNRIDPVIAILIGVLILRNAYGLVRESTEVLLEATPKHLQLENVAKAILAVEGVEGVHDLHVWTITSGLYAVSGHITVKAQTIEQGSKIIGEVSARLRNGFGIEHVTLQLERETLEKIQHMDH